MSDFESLEKQVGDAATFVAERIDRAVETAGNLLTGESGKKVAGGAALGALAAVVLPVSLAGGVLLGAGYAAYRQLSKDHGPQEHGAHHVAEHGAE